MPDVNLGEVGATVFEKLVTKTPIEQWAGSFALFDSLGEDGMKAQEAGGRYFEATLEYAENSTFRSYGETESLDLTRVNVFDAARYECKYHMGTVVFTEVEKLRAAGEGKIDLVASKVENGMNSHMANLNRSGFLDGTGNGGKDIDGLSKIITETPTNTVGQVSRNTYAWWRNVAVSGTKTTSAYDNIRSSFTEAILRCSRGGTKEQPTVGLTSRTILQGYASTLQPYERYAMDSPKARKANGAVDVGGGLMHMNAELSYDEDCSPSDSCYFINPKHLKFYYWKGAWAKAKPSAEPAHQLMSVIKVFTFGNFGTDQSRRLGVVYDIT